MISSAMNHKLNKDIYWEDPMRTVTSSEFGFSLIEIMVALVILSIGMLGVGTMLTHSMKTDTYSERQRQSEMLAETEMEMIKGMSVDWDLSSNSFNNNWAAYRWNIDKDNPTAGMNRIEIEVGWGGGSECLSNLDKCKHKTRIINYVIASSS